MALITCGECGSQISNQAPSCPKCGAPVRTAATAARSVAGGIGSVIKWTIMIVVGVPLAITAYTCTKVSTEVAERHAAENEWKQAALANMKLEFRWGTEADILMKLSGKVHNGNTFPIKDIEITCQHSAPSGTKIDSNKRTIYERIDAGASLPIKNFDMGFIHTQATSTSCSITDLAKA